MKKALVVDDHAIFRKMVSTMLKGKFEVVQAEHGLDALEKLKSNTDVAIVLSDVNMPQMDGLTMAESLRRMDEFTSLPIVFLTSERDEKMIDRAKAANVEYWLPKPFKKDQLEEMLSSIPGIL